MSDFNLPLPEFSEFEYVIDKMIQQVKDLNVWDQVRRRHTKTRSAFRSVATLSQDVGDIFGDDHANRCFAYAYGQYIQQAKRDVAMKSSIGDWTKPAKYFELAELMKSFGVSQRKAVAEQLFAIGSAILQEKPETAKRLAEEHLYAFSNMLRNATVFKPVPPILTHQLWSPSKLQDGIEQRLGFAKKRSLELISGLEKFEETRLQLLRQLRSQLWVQQNVSFWLLRLGDDPLDFRTSLVNLWLASDIAFHEHVYQAYSSVTRSRINKNLLNREAVWFMGHQATDGAISDSIKELKGVIKAIRDLNPISLVDSSSKHLVNSFNRASR